MSDNVAIVGMACRFPGSADYLEFWRNLDVGRSGVIDVSDSELRTRELGTSLHAVGPRRWLGWMDGADAFDAAFFGVSPREAELMDPQQRVLLELTWSCLEDAGHRASALRGTGVGVYIGACNHDYKELLCGVEEVEAHISTGTYAALIANRISYHFDLKGPSLTIDTACSSSLVALHEAVGALSRSECTSALVGGVSVLCSPTYFEAFGRAGMLSKRGQCRTFDHEADGYVRGEGAGVLLIEPLDRAVARGARVHGVVRGTAVNHGGKATNVTSPSAFAQAQVIVEAHRRAGTPPDTITYFEAHGTGTPKGDPIEFHGLNRALQNLSEVYSSPLPARSCAIGSVKTNIGHGEAVAGIAGIVKVLMSMKHQRLPGLLGFSRPNPRLPLERGPLYLLSQGQPWVAPDGLPRRAGVSGFGFGGVNGHVVLEEASPRTAVVASSGPHRVVISAKTAERLREYARRLSAFLCGDEGRHAELVDVAHTLGCRELLEVRAAVTASSVPELCDALDELADRTHFPAVEPVELPVIGGALVTLPTYPFERVRHWSPELGDRMVAPRVWELHPVWVERAPRGDGRSDTTSISCFVVGDGFDEGKERGWIQLPAPGDDARNWIDCIWSSIEMIQLERIARRASSLLLLSTTEEGYCAALFAMLRSVAMELGLRVAWYHGPPESFREPWSSRVLADAVHGTRSAGSGRLHLRAGALCIEERRWRPRAFRRTGTPSAWRRGGVYWIVGAGRIGCTVASHLARNHGARVILSGRSEELGVELEDGLAYRRADCTDPAQMRELTSRILAEYGELTGVIFTAGIVRDRGILGQTEAEVRRVVSTKLHGIAVLDEVTSELPLEQFVAFSSITSAMGNSGQAAYAAANAGVEWFCELRRRRGRAGGCRVVRWPYWANGGMQLTEEGIRALESTLGILPIDDATGLEILDEVVSRDEPVSTFMRGSLGVLEDVIGGGTARPESRVDRPIDPTGQPELVFSQLVRSTAKITGVPERDLAASAHFAELGLDSIMLHSICSEVNRIYGLRIGVSDFYSHSSLEALAAFIAGEAEASGSRDQRRMEIRQRRGTAGPVDMDMAIIGLDLEIAGASSLAGLQALLEDGVRRAQPYPEGRWHKLPQVLTAGRRRGDYEGFFLEDPLGFEPRLFRISPREAMLMDPQQRLVLCSTWRALEDAGYSQAEFAQRTTAVFLSIDSVDYERISCFDCELDEFRATGVSRYVAANRISYAFGLQGLSEPVSTACSSFFVGLARAMDALRSGRTEQAVVAAGQINLLPERFDLLRKRGLLAGDGMTRPFARRAGGFVRAEGVGSVVLKPLTLAREDGDHIYGVLRGAGVWHGGGGSPGLTTPNPLAHQRAMEIGLGDARLSADDIDYVEAHGTGMEIGDASEIEALQRVFGEGRARGTPCILGAAKASTGHLEAASGVVALAKVILALRTGKVSALGHADEVNDAFARSNALRPAMSDTSMRTSTDEAPLRAGLLSYGLGGVSAFVVVQRAPEPEPPTDRTIDQQRLFVISAHSPEALGLYLQQIQQYVSAAAARHESAEQFATFIDTFQGRRGHLSHRAAILAEGFDDLSTKLQHALAGGAVDGLITRQGDGEDRGGGKAERIDDTTSDVQWARIGRAWVAGSDVMWPRSTRSRVSLPTYPRVFETSYWPLLTHNSQDGQS